MFANICQSQAFLHADRETLDEALQPHVLFNYTCSDDVRMAQYRHVPTQLLPPCCVPPELMRLGSAYKVTGPQQSMLKAAVWRGMCSMTVPQLRAIVATLPGAGPIAGTGKNGSVLKKDLCQHLITSLFPDASQEDRERMLVGLMGQRAATWTDTDQAICHMVAQLDVENQQEFEPVARHAKQRMEQKLKQETEQTMADMDKRTQKCIDAATAKLKSRIEELEKEAAAREKKDLEANEQGPSAGAEAASGSASAAEPVERAAPVATGPRRTGVTPAAFKDLLPGRGKILGDFFGKHDTGKPYYKVEYYSRPLRSQ